MKANQHNLTTPDGKGVAVFEVPNCFFNNVQVCLCVKDAKDIPRAKWMVPRFKKWMYEQSQSTSSGLIVGASNVSTNRN